MYPILHFHRKFSSDVIAVLRKSQEEMKKYANRKRSEVEE